MSDLRIYLFMVMENKMLSGFVKATAVAWRDAHETPFAFMPTWAADPPSARMTAWIANPSPSLWHHSTMPTGIAYAMDHPAATSHGPECYLASIQAQAFCLIPLNSAFSRRQQGSQIILIWGNKINEKIGYLMMQL